MTETNYLNDFWTPARTEAFYPVIRANSRGRDAIRKAYGAVDDAVKLDLMKTIGEEEFQTTHWQTLFAIEYPEITGDQ